MAIREDLILDASSAFAEAARLDRAIQDAVSVDTSSLAGIDRSLRDAADSASRLQAELGDAAGASGTVEAGARDVASALGSSERQARDLTSQLGRAGQQSQALGGQITAIGTSFRGLVVGAAAAFGIRGAISLVQDAVGEFQALNESVNAVNVTFGEASGQVLAFGETSAEAAGLATSEFQRLVVPIGALLRNFGFSATDAAQQSVILTQRAADMASVMFTEVPDALNAVASGLRGQTEPLLAYGISLSEAEVSATALALGLGRTAGELTAQDKLQARIALLLQQSSRFAGDFANTSDQLANRLKITGANTTDASAALGEAFAPAVAELLELVPVLTSAMEDFAPSVASVVSAFGGAVSDPGTRAFVEFLADLPRGFGQVIDVTKAVGGSFGDIVGPAGVIASVFAGDVDSAAVALRNLAGRWSEASQATSERIITQRIIDDLRAGTDQTLAFVNALGGLQQVGGVIDADFVDSLISIAGLDPTQAMLGIQTVLAAADRLGLQAPEVNALRTAFSELEAAAAAAAPAVDELAAAAAGVAGPLGVLPAQVEAAAAAVAEAAKTVGDSVDLFSAPVEDLGVSASQVLDNLRGQVTAAASFEADIVRLVARGFDALALELLEQGPAAATAAAQFVADTGAAAEAESLLDGVGTDAARRVAEQLASELDVVTPVAVESFTRLAGEFGSPQVIGTFLAAAQAAAGTTAGGFRDEMGHQFGAITPDLVATIQEPVTAAFDGLDLVAPVTRILDGLRDAEPVRGAAQGAGSASSSSFSAAWDGLDLVSPVQRAVDDLATDTTVQGAAQSAGSATANAFFNAWDGTDLKSPVSRILDDLARDNTVQGAASSAGATVAQSFIAGLRGPKGFQARSPSKVMTSLGTQLANDLGSSFAQALNLSFPSQLAISGTLAMTGGSRTDPASGAIAGQVTGLLGTVRT